MSHVQQHTINIHVAQTDQLMKEKTEYGTK